MAKSTKTSKSLVPSTKTPAKSARVKNTVVRDPILNEFGSHGKNVLSTWKVDAPVPENLPESLREALAPNLVVVADSASTQPKTGTLRFLRLVRGHEPVGYVAYSFTEVVSGDQKKMVIEASVASKNPKDRWNPKLGRQIAEKRFSKPQNRLAFEVKGNTLEETKRHFLEDLSHSTSNKVCDKTRKAAKAMLNELNGTEIRNQLERFLTGSTSKVEKKAALVEEIIKSVLAKTGSSLA